MIAPIKSMLSRSECRLLEDGVGIAALFLILFSGLHLPGLF